MASLDEELRLDEEENKRELAFIREQIPFDAKKHYSDETILYMMDLIVGVNNLDPEYVLFIVQADLDFLEQNL